MSCRDRRKTVPSATNGHSAASTASGHARRVAALYELRPGLTVTLSLLRRMVWTAAGTTGLSLVSQGLADHVLTGLPVVRARHKINASTIKCILLISLTNQ